MAQYGLGNFLYEFSVDGKSANFKFWDPEDVTNTAEVAVTEKDFPEGVTDADSRQVAEVAYNQCSKTLNDKRDERKKREATEAFEKDTAEKASAREAAADHFAHSQDVSTAPATTETDDQGRVTNVYNTENNDDSGKTSQNSNSASNGKK